MATRDLTRAFSQLRADAKAKSLRRKNIVSHAEEGSALMKAPDATVLAVAPGWVDVVGEANQHVARIKDMSTEAVAVVAVVAGGLTRLPTRVWHDSGQAGQAAHEAADGALRRVRVAARAGDRPAHAGDHGRVPPRRARATAHGEQHPGRQLGR